MHSPTRRLGLSYLGKNKDQQDTQGVVVDVPSLQAGNAKGAKNTITEGKKFYQTQENIIPIFKYHLKDNCKYFKGFKM